MENRYIIQADSKEAVDENREQLIAIAPEIDGIFASNDITAIAAIQILTQNGYRVPDDIAVIGFGDGPIATITSPTLSTVEQKGFSIGEEAARMLINKIEEGPVPLEYETHIFTPLLRIRESTRKI